LRACRWPVAKCRRAGSAELRRRRGCHAGSARHAYRPRAFRGAMRVSGFASTAATASSRVAAGWRCSGRRPSRAGAGPGVAKSTLGARRSLCREPRWRSGPSGVGRRRRARLMRSICAAVSRSCTGPTAAARACGRWMRGRTAARG
jgi:hypothetical protein